MPVVIEVYDVIAEWCPKYSRVVVPGNFPFDNSSLSPSDDKWLIAYVFIYPFIQVILVCDIILISIYISNQIHSPEIVIRDDDRDINSNNNRIFSGKIFGGCITCYEKQHQNNCGCFE